MTRTLKIKLQRGSSSPLRCCDDGLGEVSLYLGAGTSALIWIQICCGERDKNSTERSERQQSLSFSGLKIDSRLASWNEDNGDTLIC